jgi:glycosyltransferase involved in cell wall biosynthesis
VSVPPSESSPLRILFVCHDGQLYGSQQSLLLLIKHLPKTRYTVWVSVARPGPLLEALENIPGVTVLQHKRLQWFKHDSRSWLQTVSDRLNLGLSLIPRSWTLHRYIQTYGIALVHTNSVVSLEGAIAAKLSNIPHVWHIRELFMEDNPKLQSVFSKQWTCALILKLSSAVICISTAVRKQFPEKPEQPHLPVIYNAVAPITALEGEAPTVAPYETEKPFPEFTLGYMGRMSAGKRFLDLVNALGILKKRGAQALPKLLVAGTFSDKAYEQETFTCIAQHGMTESIQFLGFQSKPEAFLRQVDLLVVPSNNEPFGRVVIEAMQAGVPCLATHTGGIPDIITDNETGFLVSPMAPEQLADKIALLLKAPEQLAMVRQRALHSVNERFSIDAQITKLDALYNTLLKAAP